MKKIAFVLVAGFFWAAAHADTTQHAKTDKNQSLYTKLGGKTAIKAVVEQFVKNCAEDKRISKFFAATASDTKRLATFKGRLVDQICQAAGGPCKYKGKDMKMAHQGMGITEGDFNALVEDLKASLDKFKVEPDAQNSLIGILAPMKSDIVENKG